MDLSSGRGLILLSLCGAASLAVALMGTIGAAFSSMGLASGAILLVDIPLLLGLIGSSSRKTLFPALSLLGSSVVIIWVLSIYAHDFANGLHSTSFFFEGWSWIYFGVNALNMLLAILKIRQIRTTNGDFSWQE